MRWLIMSHLILIYAFAYSAIFVFKGESLFFAQNPSYSPSHRQDMIEILSNGA